MVVADFQDLQKLIGLLERQPLLKIHHAREVRGDERAADPRDIGKARNASYF